MPRFGMRGVFWRQFLRWAVRNVPIWLEPVVMATCALVIFILWKPGRSGVLANLGYIHPRSWPGVNLLRTFRVFYNFGWTLDENARFREFKTIPDWEFDGFENFQRLCAHEGGAIILTAHMGSYDLGAYVFSEMCNRRIVMVRAPEIDPDTQSYESSLRTQESSVKIDFNTKAEDLAFELLRSIQGGEIVAIQGDRVTAGIASVPTRLFGQPAEVPAGPFALAMAARVPIFPLFIVRRGRRRYRLVALEPIVVERRSRVRDEDMQRAIDKWTEGLERVIRDSWHQWFHFEPFAREVD